MQYELIRTNQFKKDFKQAIKRGYDLEELYKVVSMLVAGKKLPEKYRDHELVTSRKYKNVRECHIKPDWLLVYKLEKNIMVLTLMRIGSHSDLF